MLPVMKKEVRRAISDRIAQSFSLSRLSRLYRDSVSRRYLSRVPNPLGLGQRDNRAERSPSPARIAVLLSLDPGPFDVPLDR